MHDRNSDFHDPFRRFEAMARRRFRNAQSGFQDGFAGLGDQFRMGRMVASGDLRLIVLYLIDQQPRHGYELIKQIEERTGGFYAPSPGMIYPALTWLEEAGHASSTIDGNKKLYAITDAGRGYLSDNRAAVEGLLDRLNVIATRVREWRDQFAGSAAEEAGTEADPDAEARFTHGPGRRHGRHHPRPDRDLPDVLPELNEARRALKAAILEAIDLGEDAQHRVAKILARAAEKIRANTGPDRVDLG